MTASPWMELWLRPAQADALGLDAGPWPVPAALLGELVGQPRLPLALLLHGLQRWASDPGLDGAWPPARGGSPAPAFERLQAQMRPLIHHLAGRDHRAWGTAQGDEWWLQLGAIDPEGPLVTLERAGQRLAAVAPGAGGGLVAAAWAPLDAEACRLLTGLARTVDGLTGADLRERAFLEAIALANGPASFRARMRGQTHLVAHERGIGREAGGPEAQAPRPVPMRPAELAIQLGAWYGLEGLVDDALAQAAA